MVDEEGIMRGLKPLVRVNALTLLVECRKEMRPIKQPVPLIPKRSLPDRMEEGK